MNKSTNYHNNIIADQTFKKRFLLVFKLRSGDQLERTSATDKNL